MSPLTGPSTSITSCAGIAKKSNSAPCCSNGFIFYGHSSAHDLGDINSNQWMSIDLFYRRRPETLGQSHSTAE